jgi:hypothetical protein
MMQPRVFSSYVLARESHRDREALTAHELYLSHNATLILYRYVYPYQYLSILKLVKKN